MLQGSEESVMNRLLLSVAAGLLGLGVSATDASAHGGRGHHGWGGCRHTGGGWHAAHTYLAHCPVYTVPAPAPAVQGDSGGDLAQGKVQGRCYLCVKNDTEEKLTVYVQYRTLTDKDEWQWFPADPGKSDEAVAYELDPGEEAGLRHEGWSVNASRVRIWAVAVESGSEWLDNKDEDLWLVPDGGGGERYYLAPRMESYTVTFSP
jgi:hypothetical protein